MTDQVQSGLTIAGYQADQARLLLGCGLILIGSAGIIGAWFLPAGTPDRLAAIAINGVVIALGVISLIQLDENEPFFERLMWLMVAGGVALLAYAYLGFRQRGQAAEPPTPSAPA